MAECSGDVFFFFHLGYEIGLWQQGRTVTDNLMINVSWLALIVDVILTLLNFKGKG